MLNQNVVYSMVAPCLVIATLNVDCSVLSSVCQLAICFAFQLLIVSHKQFRGFSSSGGAERSPVLAFSTDLV